MVIHVNLLAVLVGGVASMVIGMIYYADGVFGKEWKKLAKIDTKRFEKELSWNMVQVFIGALLTAYAIAFVTYLYHAYYLSSWIVAGIASSLVLFVGISATTVVIHDTLNQKPSKLINITLGNRLLSILSMGLIIGWLHP
jgi:small-conductance mechanosensitive channel